MNPSAIAIASILTIYCPAYSAYSATKSPQEASKHENQEAEPQSDRAGSIQTHFAIFSQNMYVTRKTTYSNRNI